MAIQTPPLIALVDDDKYVRRGLRSFLRATGRNVHEFSSAIEFLQSNRVDDFSCLITDVRMPYMTGTQLHQHLVGQGSLIPTVFVSAFVTDDVIALVNTGGVAAVFSKPVDLCALADLLSQILGNP